MRRPAGLLVVGALVADCALAGVAPAPASWRWLAPADGAVLTAGERVEVAWELPAGATELRWADEWEVFLSLDSGRTWSVRWTPHLDLARRRVVVQVPDLPTPDARLLLRVGDESTEREIELPIRLRIERSRDALPSSQPLPAFRRGERARAGSDGVALWAAGGRSGRGLRWFSYAGSGAGLASPRWAAVPGLLLLGPCRSGPRLARAAFAGSPSPRPLVLRPADAPGDWRWATPSVEALLASCRLNT